MLYLMYDPNRIAMLSCVFFSTGEPFKCVDVDECSSSPCLNGASCENGENQFECRCASGFDGTICDININECESNPCQNEATYVTY